jgi:diphosphomevalonate decarboxylase
VCWPSVSRFKSVATECIEELYIWMKSSCSYLVGDKSILSDAGLHSTEDVGALPAPPEVKTSGQKLKGDVSYFICSRLGAGPMVITEESQALIDSVTGLPKGV